MRFLIDECLTVDLVAIAAEAGQEARHIARVGKAGWKDWNLAAHAIAGDYILVTNNAGDFRRIYANQPLHPGFIIIIPNAGRVLQRQVFRAVLEALPALGDLVNRAVEADINGDDVAISAYDLPTP